MRAAEASLGEPAVAVGLWQDGVPCYWDRSISCEMLSMLLPSLDGKYKNFRAPLAAILKTNISKNTFDDMFEVIRWSFVCLAAGRWPSKRHDGSDFTSEDTWRKKQCKNKVRLPIRGVLAQLKGDWKMFKEVLKLPGWNDGAGCCPFCNIRPEQVCNLRGFRKGHPGHAPWR